jgi:hypothetical protein
MTKRVFKIHDNGLSDALDIVSAAYGSTVSADGKTVVEDRDLLYVKYQNPGHPNVINKIVTRRDDPLLHAAIIASGLAVAPCDLAVAQDRHDTVLAEIALEQEAHAEKLAKIEAKKQEMRK